MMVGRRWVSFWDCLFLGAMLNFPGVDLKKPTPSQCLNPNGARSASCKVFSDLARRIVGNSSCGLVVWSSLMGQNGHFLFILLELEEIRLTSWYGKKTSIIYRVFKKKYQVVSWISEPSTVGSMGYLPGFTIEHHQTNRLCTKYKARKSYGLGVKNHLA